MNDILVSVNCITYNHEDYIADAIDSFLMQKTEFAYEILIHDDASTDRTAEIIREYELKYPNIIKPIYQTENQHSKGVKVGSINRERAKGKYIAFCEGDDFWIDPLKLQKQVDYMESHPECSLCVHAAIIIDARSNNKVGEVRPGRGNRYFSVEEIIQGGGALFATNSIIAPKECLLTRPDLFNIASVGDYPLFIHLALCGKAFYLDEYMSAYRVGVPGSWTKRVHSDINRRIETNESIFAMLDELNRYTNQQYEKSINQIKRSSQFDVLLSQGRLREVKSAKYKEFYKKLTIKHRIYLHAKRYCPVLLDILIAAKRMIKD